MALWMQPRIPSAFLAARADCWLMFNLVTTRTVRSFSGPFPDGWQILVHGFVPSNCKNFPLNFVELYKVPGSSFGQPVEIPLYGNRYICHSSQFYITFKFAEGVLFLIAQVISYHPLKTISWNKGSRHPLIEGHWQGLLSMSFSSISLTSQQQYPHTSRSSLLILGIVSVCSKLKETKPRNGCTNCRVCWLPPLAVLLHNVYNIYHSLYTATQFFFIV